MLLILGADCELVSGQGFLRLSSRLGRSLRRVSAKTEEDESLNQLIAIKEERDDEELLSPA